MAGSSVTRPPVIFLPTATPTTLAFQRRARSTLRFTALILSHPTGMAPRRFGCGTPVYSPLHLIPHVDSSSPEGWGDGLRLKHGLGANGVRARVEGLAAAPPAAPALRGSRRSPKGPGPGGRPR